ncbi:adenine nucleotide alpha-hydrolase family protein [Marinilabilia rubra]|uniref:Exoenzyme S synthesis protein B n=1 Tax=Marinilabilia rubra TaxID=2162893 RepID=A0A2U2BD65_9BACT|nr:exoenzyme S synthesis protein B [Marinilabilia rubra]PWE01008.1 exoenzyme S synthesis protein B [Marinilabilia rubra]
MKDILIEHLKKTPSFYLLFSGGFDSCSILGCAIEAGLDVRPVWIDNGFNRVTERDIREQAANMGCQNLEIIPMTPEPKIMSNPVDRCYHCKGQLIAPVISGKNEPVFDGTNASDSENYRPGVKALRQGGVRSPLAEINITKEQARTMALTMGSDPVIANMEGCLATRFNYNLNITTERLNTIREIEQTILKATGDYHLRCRMDDEDHLRIECREKATFLKLIDPEFRTQIVEKGKQIATFVTLDLEGARKNAFDKKLGL